MSQMPMVRTGAGLGAAGLLLAALTLPAQASALVPVGAGAPETTDDWYAWADDAATQAQDTDWAAVSEASGCTLVDVEIGEVVDEQANLQVGAPADLAVTVVERVEDCAAAPTTLRQATAAGTTQDSLAGAARAASACAGTSGPGQICLARSGSFVNTTWRYNGSGRVEAFLRIYNPSGSSCGRSGIIATSATSTYSPGQQRSLSVSAPRADTYQANVWRHVGLGHHTSWGSICRAL